MQTGVGEVILSKMGPQSTHILPHTASHNVRYTAHLPLIVPTATVSNRVDSATNGTLDESKIDKNETNSKECYIRIGEEICHWEVGKMLVFDDSYEHEVINTTNEVRIVLLLRFWHPLLRTPTDRNKAIEYIEQATQMDQLQRFNPPIPPLNNDDYNVRLHRRRMEQSYCPNCQQTRYLSIRCIVVTRSFICACGREI